MMGTTSERKWGTRPDIKRMERREIFGTQRKEELFLHHVHPSLPLEALTYGTSCAARLGIKYIHA